MHSILPPSSAARRVACPGSRALEAMYPQAESERSREGAAAHWLAQISIDPKASAMNLFKKESPNGVEITEDMIEGANFYQGYIYAYCPDFRELHVEERVDISNVHHECWGTPDCWVQVGSELHVFDYKYGFKIVEAFENWQLLEYAAGILDKINGILRIHLHIIQPRGYAAVNRARSWTLEYSDMLVYIDRLKKAEAEAIKERAECRPNPECNNCSARHACPALQQLTYDIIDQSALNTPHHLPPTVLGRELKLLKKSQAMLDARITGLEEQAIAEIKSGKRVPYFRLSQQFGRRKWKKDAKEVIILGELLNIDLSKPQECVTPTQAIKAGVSEEVIKAYSEVTNGQLKLVEDGLNQTRKLFSDD